MEMKAEEDIDVGKDITPAILPLAFALSDSFLASHCSSCFRPLNPSLHSLPSTSPARLSSHAYCNSHVRYCSHACHSADSHLHVSSGECHLLQSQSNASWHGDSVDLRVALRLLASLGDSAVPATAGRIGGLMTNRGQLEEEEEISETIRDGGRMMFLARRGCWRGGEEREERVDCSMEEDVLCLVLTNGVEVQVGEGRAIGTAVYGPCFSWFNHSCVPNACYRFSLTGPGELDSGGTEFLVSANSKDTACKTRIADESKLIKRNGPRVIVRSIKPIKKGEEVCIAYIDLLQPKICRMLIRTCPQRGASFFSEDLTIESSWQMIHLSNMPLLIILSTFSTIEALRRSELLLKYRFDCCCSRCTASPPTYVDSVLEGNVANLSAASCLYYSSCKAEYYEELNGCLNQALEDVSSGNPNACFKRLEFMLAEGFKVGFLQQQEPLPEFKLHPLHHLCLGSYITLSSAYKICANSLLVHVSDTDNQHDALRLRRAAAACSLLLAGAAHHFFSLEASLIASAAHFWTNAGESLLALVSDSSWSTLAKQRSKSDSLTVLSSLNDECTLIRELEAYLACSQTRMHNDNIGELYKICQRFFYCVRGMLTKLWPFLVHDLGYLKAIEDPVDFRWLGLVSLQQLDEAQMAVRGEEASSVFGQVDEVGEKSLFRLAAHCLLFGGYLSGICYSEHGYLSLFVRSLVRAQKETRLGKSAFPRTG